MASSSIPFHQAFLDENKGQLRIIGAYEYLDLDVKDNSGKPVSALMMYQDRDGLRNGYTKATAMLEFWRANQQVIYAVLEQARREGWEPISEVSPACLIVESTTTSSKSLLGAFTKALVWPQWGFYGFRITLKRASNGNYANQQILTSSPTDYNVSSGASDTTPPNLNLATDDVLQTPVGILTFASIGAGFAAFLIDLIVFIVIGTIAITFVFSLHPNGAVYYTNQLSFGAIAFLIEIFSPFILYAIYRVWTTARSGATIGKKMVGIKVVTANGTPPGFVKAFNREVIGFLLDCLSWYIGFLAVFWDKRRQCWHDKIAQTFVVKSI